MTILEMSNAHLEGYNPNANIHTSKGNKFRDVISKIFSTTRHSSTEAALRHKWVKYYFIAMLRRLYTDPAAPSAFSSLHKLQQAAATPKGKQIKHKKQKTPTQIKEWLETQDAYMLHRPLRKRFPRNPYTVNNIDDVWELDTLDLSSLKKFNNYRYLLQVIDVFSNYLYSVPLRTKTGKEVAAALESIFMDPKYTKPISRRPVWVCTDKGKEFLNTQFQALLKLEGIEFQVCRNPDVKCAVVVLVN